MDSNIESEQLLFPFSSDMDSMWGDPVALPRVGDQYQAEIPPLTKEIAHEPLVQKVNFAELMADSSNYFALGLPIPLMWSQCQAENFKKEDLEVHPNQHGAADKNGMPKVEASKDLEITSKNEDEEVKDEVKSVHTPLDNGQELGLPALPSLIPGDNMDIDSLLPEEKKTKLDLADSGGCPLPGSPGEPWTATECDSFVLGLFIFGKHLLLVKRFVKSKEMGDVLGYYYGKFYRCDEHRRWSESRKMKSRRCINGQKIFTGWRLQELLSRLFAMVPEGCQDMLKEVCGKFGAGKISLEEYIFAFKETVGINLLLEAVGIGKGKQDLTGTSMEPTKNNKIFSVHPDFPIGKACSSLTSEDIVKFLTGDFKLSKARKNDLFWEAVWPRLLARGWHSEQSSNRYLPSTKHSLIFLIPGVKKFSRRRQVKGNHYFDSVNDVLNKVASDPKLLEVESKEAMGSREKEEHQSNSPLEQTSDDSLNFRPHCYLQPSVSRCDYELMKFTVVDTSLIDGEENCKVRELRTLPIGTRITSVAHNLASEIDQGSSEEFQDEAEEINASNLANDRTESGSFADSPEQSNAQENGLPNGPDHEGSCTGVSPDKEFMGILKFQFGAKVKSGKSNYLSPVRKLQQWTACGDGESSSIVENISKETKLNEDESASGLTTTDACENMKSELSLSQNLSAGSSLAQGSTVESVEGILGGTCLVARPSPQKPQPKTLIDLNLPPVPQEPETCESSITEIAHNDHDLGSKGSTFPNAVQPPALIGRRQGTRNRPLTAKALEAIACGFLSTKRKRKCVDVQTQSDSVSRSSRQVRSRTDASSTSNGTADNDTAS